MNRTPQFAFRLAALAAIAATVSLTACNRPASETVGQTVDGSIAEVKSATQEMSADARAAAARSAAAVTGSAKDMTITTKVNAALAADSKLSAMRINVDTTDGRVALNGTAPDAMSRDRAKTLAAAVEGVVTVDNRLTVGQTK